MIIGLLRSRLSGLLYRFVVWPIFRRLNPETAHHLAFLPLWAAQWWIDHFGKKLTEGERIRTFYVLCVLDHQHEYATHDRAPFPRRTFYHQSSAANIHSHQDNVCLRDLTGSTTAFAMMQNSARRVLKEA